MTTRTDLSRQLAELIKKHKVPGASVAVLDGDDMECAVAGVVNNVTRVRTTPDTLFQIGSITKVYTATLVMQLVDDGKVELDAPVKRYVPDLKLRDEAAARAITVRHLLTHTSGLPGDYFPTCGRGDDAVKRYVRSLRKVGLAHTPGEFWSYSNAGSVLAGYVVERVTGLTWDGALRAKLLEPAGLAEHASLAEDVLLHRAAAGHVPTGRRPQLSTVWQMDRSGAPAGATLCASARDVVRFAQIHLRHGRAADGTKILSAKSTKAMQTKQVSRPGGGNVAMGLGWVFTNWRGDDGPVRMVWHNGGTLGQSSHLYVVPSRGFAMCVLTNLNAGGSLISEIGNAVLAERLGTRPPETPALPAKPPRVDLTKYAGRYERHGVRFDASVQDDSLHMDVLLTALGDEVRQSMTLKPITATEFAIVVNGSVGGVVSFLELDDDGRPEYLWLSRIARRTS